MKRPILSRFYAFRHIILGGLLMAALSSMNPARADDDDYRDHRWREHQQREEGWRNHEHERGHWDHRYWDGDHDRDRDYYRPPTTYYDPDPPSGLSFVFRGGR